MARVVEDERAFSKCMNIFPFILFFRMDPILSLICLPIKREKSMVVDSLLNDYAIHFDFPCVCEHVRHIFIYSTYTHVEYSIEARSTHSLPTNKEVKRRKKPLQ